MKRNISSYKRKTNVKPDLITTSIIRTLYHSNIPLSECFIILIICFILCVYISFIQHLFIAVIYITVFLPSIKNIKANSQNKISLHFNMNIYIGIVHGSIIISWKWKRIGLLVGIKCENIKRRKKHYF